MGAGMNGMTGSPAPGNFMQQVRPCLQNTWPYGFHAAEIILVSMWLLFHSHYSLVMQPLCFHRWNAIRRKVKIVNMPKKKYIACHCLISAWDVQPRTARSSSVPRTGPARPALTPAAYHSHVCGSTTQDPEGAPLRGLPEVHWGLELRVNHCEQVGPNPQRC